MTVAHGDVHLFRVGRLCDDRFETAPPRQGRVGTGWRPKAGFNNAVLSMAGSLEWHGWGWVGTRSWAGGWGRVPMSSVRASVRAHVRVASGGSSRTTQEGYIQ